MKAIAIVVLLVLSCSERTALRPVGFHVISNAEEEPLLSAAKRGALSSIVERGCIYVAHYVRDNYYDYPFVRRQGTVVTTTSAGPTTVAMPTTTHLNWVSLLHDTMRKDYVPMELFKALMNCGKEYAMYAINASDDIKSILGVNYGAVPGLG